MHAAAWGNPADRGSARMHSPTSSASSVSLPCPWSSG